MTEKKNLEQLPVESTVWYISSTESFKSSTEKFDWYIPATVQSYITKCPEVKGYSYSYVLSLDNTNYEDDKVTTTGWMKGEARRAEKEMKDACPTKVILRWDKRLPICPLKSLEDSLREDSLRKILIKASLRDDSFRKILMDSLREGSFRNILMDSLREDLPQRKSVSFHEKAKEEYGENFGFEGKTQNGLGPEMWGITLEQLQAVMKHENFTKIVNAKYTGKRVSGGMKMYEVVEKIFKKETKGKGMGYALLLNKEKPLRAKVMVSHSWGEDYEHFVSALQDSGEKGPFWICSTALYQCEDIPDITIEEQMGPNPSNGAFATILKQAEKMVCVVTPEGDIYKRLWCVYEMYVAVKLGVAVQMAYFSESTGWGKANQPYSNVAMKTASDHVETSKAETTKTKDKYRIHGEVKKDDRGFDLLDEVIYWVKVTSLIENLEVGKKEITIKRPFGICSASCAEARVNEAIATVIDTWGKHKGKSIPRKKFLHDSRDDRGLAGRFPVADCHF